MMTPSDQLWVVDFDISQLIISNKPDKRVVVIPLFSPTATSQDLAPLSIC